MFTLRFAYLVEEKKSQPVTKVGYPPTKSLTKLCVDVWSPIKNLLYFPQFILSVTRYNQDIQKSTKCKNTEVKRSKIKRTE